MAEETNDLQSLIKPPQPEEIRAEMADTRSALTEKLVALEDRVKSTVESAQFTVEQTVETVKESVHDTVRSVKRTFDVSYQVDQHPWAMVGASVAAGFMLGKALTEKPPVVIASNGIGNGHPNSLSAMTGSAPRREHSVVRHSAKRSSAKKGFLGQFHEEIGMLEKAAIGTMMGLARDWLKQAIPPLAPHLEKVMDSATTKMGGEPVGATAGSGAFASSQYARNRTADY